MLLWFLISGDKFLDATLEIFGDRFLDTALEVLVDFGSVGWQMSIISGNGSRFWYEDSVWIIDSSSVTSLTVKAEKVH